MIPSLITIAGWCAFAFLIALCVWGGVRLLYEIEDFIATKLREDALGHDTYGDVPAIPSDLKLFHNGTEYHDA